MLLAVPNFSEGRDAAVVARVSDAFSGEARLLDTHTDAVHNRSVLTLAGPPEQLCDSVVAGLAACVEEIDMREHAGAHPCIGALDVAPLVYTAGGDREAAADAARRAARAIAEAGVPVFLYGDLASAPERRERAYFRRGGLARLAERMASEGLEADLGPGAPHASAGATLVTARPPLAAFNVLLDRGDMDMAREVAARLRERGGGLPGVRAIAVDLGEGGPQISTNVHDPISVPLADVVARIAELAEPAGALPRSAEVVGLVPEAALVGFPEDLAVPGFDPERHVIERAARTV
jgi:glutamate formiminotransferase